MFRVGPDFTTICENRNKFIGEFSIKKYWVTKKRKKTNSARYRNSA
uniref:Uncharacterized protein n=1 Tax=viral metagenome TaxID=1070528 RepID=A0A6C0I4C2_9ZZZZ